MSVDGIAILFLSVPFLQQFELYNTSTLLQQYRKETIGCVDDPIPLQYEGLVVGRPRMPYVVSVGLYSLSRLSNVNIDHALVTVLALRDSHVLPTSWRGYRNALLLGLQNNGGS